MCAVPTRITLRSIAMAVSALSRETTWAFCGLLMSITWPLASSTRRIAIGVSVGSGTSPGPGRRTGSEPVTRTPSLASVEYASAISIGVQQCRSPPSAIAGSAPIGRAMPIRCATRRMRSVPMRSASWAKTVLSEYVVAVVSGYQPAVGALVVVHRPDRAAPAARS